MANYSRFKRIDADAIIDGGISSTDITNDTIPNAAIADTNVPSTAFSGTVTSEKLGTNINLSGRTISYRTLANADFSASANIAGGKLGSGAAVNNLGYTPINPAGDTMTGNLTLSAGSSGAPSIAKSGNTNTGINITSNQLNFVVGGTNALEFDSSGRVRRQSHPAFAAFGQNGWLYASNYGGTGYRDLGSAHNWGMAHQTGGSNFNTSNGRYTAPVSGYYIFHTHYFFLNDNNSTANYIHHFFIRNGGAGYAVGGRAPYTINMHGNRNNYDDGASYSGLMQLNAGDNCGLGIYWNGNGARLHAGHQIFSGYLIG